MRSDKEQARTAVALAVRVHFTILSVGVWVS